MMYIPALQQFDNTLHFCHSLHGCICTCTHTHKYTHTLLPFPPTHKYTPTHTT